MIKSCRVCSKEFHVKPSKLDKKHYCSRLCMANDYSSRLKGDLNPNYKNGAQSSIHTCKSCGSEFVAPRCHKRKFCSNKCVGVIKRKPKPEKEKAIRVPGVTRKYFCMDCNVNEVKRKTFRCETCRYNLRYDTRNCIKCGVEFTFSKLRKQKKIYCSKECSNADRKGEKNQNYKGGITPLNKKIRASDEYKAWRKTVFTRDNYTCQWCGQYGWELHADHIKPFAQFPELRLDVNNGRTLCKSCHQKTDSFLKKTKKNAA